MTVLGLVLFVIMLGTLQTRPDLARPATDRRTWGIASRPRELVRASVSVVLAFASLYFEDAGSMPLSAVLMVAAWAAQFSWLPGAIRQSIRLRSIPATLQEAREALTSERLPDMLLAAVLLTPPFDRLAIHGLNQPRELLQLNAKHLTQLPGTHLHATDIPALRKFIEAAIADHLHISRSGEVRMDEFDMATTYDLYFPEILKAAIQFVQHDGNLHDIAEVAHRYGVETALAHAGVPDEYLSVLAARREIILLNR